MNKQEVEKLLPFYVAGTLDEVEKREVKQALASDEELRRELGFWNTLGTAANKYFAGQEHPSIDELASYALGELHGQPDRESEMQRHLDVCEECLEEYRIICRPEPLHRKLTQGIRQRIVVAQHKVMAPFVMWVADALRPPKLVYVTATLLVAVVAAVYLMNRLSPHDQVYSLAFAYQETSRSETVAAPRVVIPEGTTLIDFAVPVYHEPDARYSYRLTTPSGEVVTFPEAVKPAVSGETIDTLRITTPIKYFGTHPGSYRWAITMVAPPKQIPEAVTYQYPFEVSFPSQN